MEIKADLHCHTIASTHAYSTVWELAKYASSVGLEAIAITDHAPALSDAPHIWHFENLPTLPRTLEGVTLLRGAEANIVDISGNIDLPEYILKRLDIVVASIHSPCYSASRETDHTRAYMKAVEDPYIDIIGHSGSPAYKYDYEAVILKAKENRKLMEINEHSFAVRKSSVSNCKTIALLCKKHGVPVTVDSDAHFITDLGNYSEALAMLRSIDFPEDLIINTSYEKIKQYLAPRKSIGE